MDTAIGAVATQVIMAAVLIATAATLAKAGGDHPLDTIEEIVGAITPFLGNFAGKLLFCLGMIGASTVAAIVVTLTAARTLAEVLGAKHKLEDEPREAPWFYGFYAMALIVCAVVVASGVNLVSLSVGVQVMNALLLPIVLGFLFLLARRLPQPYRLQGRHALVSGAIISGDGGVRRLFRRRGPLGVRGRRFEGGVGSGLAIESCGDFRSLRRAVVADCALGVLFGADRRKLGSPSPKGRRWRGAPDEGRALNDFGANPSSPVLLPMGEGSPRPSVQSAS